MVYYGKGYTNADIGEMSISELLWHVHRLKKQLEEEKEAIEEQHRKLRSTRRG